MRKCMILLTFLFIGTVGYPQKIDESIPKFCEMILVKTNKEETAKLLKERGFVIKSKDYVQNRYLLSGEETDRCLVGVGNYGFVCMVDFAPSGKRVFMSNVKFFSPQGAMVELAKSGYEYSHTNEYDKQFVYKKTVNGYLYAMFISCKATNDGQYSISYELTSELMAEIGNRTENLQSSAEGIAVNSNTLSIHDTGNSHSLVGRSLVGGLVMPDCKVFEEGRIVIEITVDEEGTVINAIVGKGTNINNPKLRNATVEAVKKTKFNKSDTEKAQTGTITYRFHLK